MDDEIIYIQPNPEVYPDVIAVATQNDECKLIRYMTSEIMATLPNSTTMSWSPKGKQIVCGTKDARLIAYDMEGNQKDEIPSPPNQNDPDVYVNAVLWVENHVFLAIYSKSTNGEHVHRPYMINRKSESLSEKYILMGEVNPIYDFECPDSHFYISVIRNFGSEIKTLIVLANSAAGDLAIIGQDQQGEWSTWMLDENIPSLPLSEDDVTDTYPIGLTIDFSASEPLAPFDPAESETPVPPMPIVLFMTNEGRICAFHAYNSDLARSGEKYVGMVTAQDINSIPEPAAFPQVPEATATVVASEFRTPENVPTFGETPSKIPSFSSLGTTTTVAKPSVSTPTFGSALSSPPTFGSTSSVGFGAFGTPAGSGQTVSFASLAKSASTNTSTPASASAFGYGGATNVSSTFGETSSFGSFGSFGSKAPVVTPSFGSFASKVPVVTPSYGSFESKASVEAPTPSFGSKSLFGVAPAIPPSFGSTPSFGSVTQSFGSISFATAATKKKPFIESESKEETVGAKSMPGLPSFTTETPEVCSLKFEDVKKAIEDVSDSGSDISKVSSIDKSKDAFGFSLESVSDALGSTIDERDTISLDTTSTGEADKENEIEKKIAEENRIEKEKRVEKETQYAEEKQALEESIIEEHKKVVDENRIAQEKQAVEKKRIADEKRAVEGEEERVTQEKRVIEEKRVAEKKRIVEEMGIAEEGRVADEKKITEEKRLEQEMIAEEKRLEEERIAEKQRLEEERLAAIKPDPLFATRDRFEPMYPAEHARAVGISVLEKENLIKYFNLIL